MSQRSQSILGLGHTHLTLACFAKEEKGNGLQLELWKHVPLETRDKSFEGWLAVLRPGLDELREALGKGVELSVVLPPWLVTHRWFRAARITQGSQRDVIAYEGAKLMPEGLEGQAWDYALWSEEGFEVPVLLQAIPEAQLEQLKQVFESAGLCIGQIESAAGVYSSLSSLGDAGASLVLDLGASSSLLMVTEGERSLFGRVLAFGADQVTENLAAEWNVDFAEAERHKIKALCGSGSEEDRPCLEQASQGYVQRLKSELNRSLALYRRQYPDRKPHRICLAGGASRLPGLDTFLGEALGLPVVHLDAELELSCGPRVSRSEVSGNAGRISLLAAAGLGAKAGTGTNLNLQEQAVRSDHLGKRVWFAVALLLLAAVIPSIRWELEALALQGKSREMEALAIPAERIQLRMDPIWNENQQLEADLRDWVQISRKRAYWGDFLADLQERLAEVGDVWLDSMQLEEFAADTGDVPVTVLVVSGQLLDRENPLASVSQNAQQKVVSLVSGLAESPYVTGVEQRAFDTSQAGVLPFTFALQLAGKEEEAP